MISKISTCHEPGLLLVYTRPKSPLYLDEFHQWYNTEHGPSRMKLDFIETGYRYRCKDDTAIWAGLYDLKRLSGVAESQYVNLRKHRSTRERDVMENMVDVLERKFYRQISSRGACNDPAPVVTCVTFVVKREDVEEVNRWYEEEHIDDLSRVPGWQRSRRFEVIEGDVPSGCVELLAIHEFEQDNGLGGPEHMRARHRPWREKIVQLAKLRVNREFEFYHQFRSEDYVAPPEHPVLGFNSLRGTGAMLERRPSLVASGQEQGERSLVDLNTSQTLLSHVH